MERCSRQRNDEECFVDGSQRHLCVSMWDSVCTETWKETIPKSSSARVSHVRHRQSFLNLAYTRSGVQGGGNWRGGPCRHVTPVMRHVCFNKVARSESAAEAELSG